MPKIAKILLIILSIVLISGGVFYYLKIEKSKQLESASLMLKAWPSDSLIIVSGSGVIKTGTGQLNLKLTPGQFQVEVKKSGYQSWSNNYNLALNDKIRNQGIYLIPEELIVETLVNVPINNLLLLPNNNQIVYQSTIENNKKISYILGIYNRLNKATANIISSSNPLSNLNVSPDSKLLIAKAVKNTSLDSQKISSDSWLLVDLTENYINRFSNITTRITSGLNALKTKREIDKKADGTIAQITWIDNNHLIARTKDALYSYTLFENELTPIYKGQASNIAALDNFLYFINKDGLLTSLKIDDKSANTHSPTSLFINPKEPIDQYFIKLSNSNKKILVLKNNQNIWLYENGDINKIADQYIDTVFSNDKQKIIILENNGIKTYPDNFSFNINSPLQAFTYKDNNHILVNAASGLSIIDFNNNASYPLANVNSQGLTQYDNSLDYIYFSDSTGLKKVSL